jgi:hypothetical protein
MTTFSLRTVANCNKAQTKPSIYLSMHRKRIYFCALLVLATTCQHSLAQTPSTIQYQGGSQLSIGATLPFGADSFGIGRQMLHANFYKPLLSTRNGWRNMSKRNATLGMFLGGNYLLSPAANYTSSNLYNVFTQASAPTNTFNVAASKGASFGLELGPRLDVNLGKFTLSPMLGLNFNKIAKAGYTEFAEYNILPDSLVKVRMKTQQAIDESSFGLSPKFRLAYNFSRFSLWWQYQSSTPIEFISSYDKLIPKGPPIQNGTYELEQITTGSYEVIEQKSEYKIPTMCAGIAVHFGKPKTKEHIRKVDVEPTTPAGTAVDIQENDEQGPQDCKPIITTPSNNEVLSDAKRLHVNVKFPQGYEGSRDARIYKVSDDVNGIAQAKQKLSYSNPEQIVRLEKSLKTEPALTVPVTIDGIEALATKNLQPGVYATFVGNGSCVAAPVFFIVSSCFPKTELTIDSSTCLPDGKNKIYGHFTIEAGGRPVTAVTLASIQNITDGTTVTPSSITPSSFPTTVGTTTFTIVAPNISCKDVKINLDVSWTDCNNNPQTTPCNATQKMKCCFCNFCDEIKISAKSKYAKIEIQGNSLKIKQQLTTSLQAGQYTLSAELIEFSSIASARDCYLCNPAGQSLGTLDSVKFTKEKQQKQQFELKPNISVGQTGSSNPLPTLKDLDVANLTIGLPPITSCCSDEIAFCIRYKFTTVDCKVCSVIVCYTAKRDSN